jgi:hypothetical protein
MTTLDEPTARGSLDSILKRLEELQARRWRLRVATGLLATATAVAAGLLLAAGAGGYWPDQPPAALRYAVAGVLGTLWLGVAVLVVARPLLWRASAAEIARFAEGALPEVRNDLINAVLLADDHQQASPELVASAIDEAEQHIRSVDLSMSLSRRPLRNWAIGAGLAVVMLVAFAALQPRAMARGLAAIFSPGQYVPAVNDLELFSLEPGDTTCFAGENVTVTARIANPEHQKLAARLLVDGRQPTPMLATDGYATFSASLGSLDDDTRYAVEIGESRWPEDRPWYNVTVLRRVEVTSLAIRYDYPTYTGIEDKTVTSAAGAIEAPVGTKATVELTLATAAPAASLYTRDGGVVAMTPAGGSTRYSASLPINEDGGYRIVLTDSRGRTLAQLPDASATASSPAAHNSDNGYYPIRAIPDRPPAVEIISPGRDVALAPGQGLTLVIKASDDHGVADCQLAGASPDGRGAFASEWPGPLGREKTFEFALTIPADLPDDGSVVLTYAATVSDNRDVPGLDAQKARSSEFKITVQDAAKVAAERQKRYDELRRKLMAILAAQEKQRLATALCAQTHGTLATVNQAGKAIAAAQQSIRFELVDLVDNFPFEPEMTPIRQACALLAANEAAAAIEQAGVLERLANLDGRAEACAPLARTQDRIIDTLQTLLAIMPGLQGRPTEAKSTPGGDITPEGREKLAQLKADLEKYIEGQKKLVAAAEQLAKKPVDNFTAEDDKLLNELRLGQQDWEKFINERLADFSKLAQQDFSNPVMLKELISVKTDVTMAKDALAQKAVEIATALEANGIENAESLTANIEKWLPDEPDRKKWSMEAPDAQENIEQAELPTELEDLVGDLLEQEEDLFEEMDDISSSYTQSGDKGIGWDAADGPISNMNAQGVTGNQLPNTSEIQGRSAEGRSGKSSGEFVEDKAVGKGGRRTPTRLTPEPFSRGEVNDVSADQAGGATGGGKVSGSGQEGLEGPVPPELAKEMKRLAGKQATLVNHAERVRAAMKQDDYTSFQMLRAITLMNRVQNDLEANRYQNVLRKREETIEALRQTRLLLAGEIDIDVDTSAAMPKYVRDDIADAMKGSMPAGYEDVMRQYYERLSEEAHQP